MNMMNERWMNFSPWEDAILQADSVDSGMIMNDEVGVVNVQARFDDTRMGDGIMFLGRHVSDVGETYGVMSVREFVVDSEVHSPDACNLPGR